MGSGLESKMLAAARLAASRAWAVGALSVAVLAICTATSPPGRGQDKVPGLTGTDRPEDVVMARQLLMDTVGAEMAPLDQAAGGNEFNFAEAQPRAYMISTLMTVFPHLFPPQTRPVTPPDGSPPSTAARPAVWESFDDFYEKAQSSATLAFDASRAENPEQFRDLAKKLRAACDACHAAYMRVEAPSPP
jgi:cytochrome c556